MALDVIASLRRDELLRAVNSAGSDEFLQLDHDYLASAVLAEARRARRWAVALAEAKTKFDNARDSLKLRWNALLPTNALLAICWERLRGRLTFGDASAYFSISAARSLVMFGLILSSAGAAVAWNQDRLISQDARAIVQRFGGSYSTSAILVNWASRPSLRRRVYELVRMDDSLFEKALGASWPLAHAGIDGSAAKEAALLLEQRLRSTCTVGFFMFEWCTESYAGLAPRVNDVEYARKQARFLYSLLTKEKDQYKLEPLSKAYSMIVSWAYDDAAASADVAGLREALTRTEDFFLLEYIGAAYAAAASKLTSSASVHEEITKLRDEFIAADKSHEDAFESHADAIANAYSAIAPLMRDPNDAKNGVATFREAFAREKSRSSIKAYVSIPSKLLRPSDVERETNALDGIMSNPDFQGGDSYWLEKAYSSIMKETTDQTVIRAQANAMLVMMRDARYKRTTNEFATIYSKLSRQMTEREDLNAAAKELTSLLASDTTQILGTVSFTVSKALIAMKMGDEIGMRSMSNSLRSLILKQSDNDYHFGDELMDTYLLLVQRLHDGAAVKALASDLRSQFGSQKVAHRDQWDLELYLKALSQISRIEDVNFEAELIFEMLTQNRYKESRQYLALAYAAASKKRDDIEKMRAESSWLRNHVDIKRVDGFPTNFLIAFSAVAARLTGPQDIVQNLDFLTHRLETASSDDDATSLASAYEEVAKNTLIRLPKEKLNEQIATLVVLTGQPRLLSPAPLLAALKPVAGANSVGSIQSALLWAHREHGMALDETRPRLGIDYLSRPSVE
ncbi:hypothetical protein PQR09_36505 [Paraburkholderia sediminicola]